MHPFEQNNSCITALVQGQATAGIAFISKKNVLHLILTSLRQHRFSHMSLPDFAMDVESPSYL